MRAVNVQELMSTEGISTSQAFEIIEGLKPEVIYFPAGSSSHCSAAFEIALLLCPCGCAIESRCDLVFFQLTSAFCLLGSSLPT